VTEWIGTGSRFHDIEEQLPYWSWVILLYGSNRQSVTALTWIIAFRSLSRNAEITSRVGTDRANVSNHPAGAPPAAN
jgi:hypothetical protein